MIVFWNILSDKKIQHKNIIIYFLIGIVYIISRYTLVSFPNSGEYTMGFDLKLLLTNTRNYLFWSFNWPEEIKNQFISFFIPNPVFLIGFRTYLIPLTIFSVIIILFLYILPIVESVRLKNKLPKTFFFGAGWFFIALLPVIFFINHSYAYYLPIPLWGLFLTGLIGYSNLSGIIFHRYRKHTTIVICLFWLVSSMITTRFTNLTHWAIRRGYMSKTIVNKMLTLYPMLPAYAVIYHRDPGKDDDNKWILADQSAARVIYNEDTILSYYGAISLYEYWLRNPQLYECSTKNIYVLL